MTDISVTNSGPIEGTFKIDLTPGPGAYEFRGQRGSGKTTLISSLDWMTGHKVDVTLHDGAVSGNIEGFGVIAPIGGRKRRKGAFELDTIDAEKFSIADLIDPPGKTPEVRDRHAIKALAVLSDAKADPKLYYDLAGGQAAFDDMAIAPSDDPVLLATRVKDAFDKLARDKQRTAEAEAGHAVPLEHIPDDLDITKSCDLELLGSARDSARDEFQRLKAEREHGLKKESEVVSAKERLTKIADNYTGLSIADAETKRQSTIEKGTAAKANVTELEQALKDARAAVESCTAEYQAAHQIFEAAKSHQSAVESLLETASLVVEYPTNERVTESESKVTASTTAYNDGVRLRDVKKNQASAQSHREAEKKAQAAADEAKNKSGQVFDVLAKSLHTKHLIIEVVDGNPRLFVKHSKRGKCAFDRVNGLSDGERVDYTLRELLPHLSSPGLLPIPQRVWQDLQPSDRQSLHELAAKRNLYLFGAQVDDGPLRVVYLGGDSRPASLFSDVPFEDA